MNSGNPAPTPETGPSNADATPLAPPSPASAFAPASEKPAAKGSTFWLTRFVILRLLGFVYLTAFLVAAHQIVPLIGHEGLLPADQYLTRVAAHFGSKAAAFREMPTLFWWNVSDAWLAGVAWTGAALSFAVLCGFANSIILLVLWALYMSIIHVGQLWYSYGWETQLLETGFIAVFLSPLWDARPFARHPPPLAAIWIYRWLIFRIMLGAGLIKIRGDECWRDLTALFYHYETQPVPNPFSRLFHFAPQWFHKLGVLWNHCVELVVPWFAFWPRQGAALAGVVMAGFMGVLILSGNLSFLNWLTIIPALACIDDSFWRRILPAALVQRADVAAAAPKISRLRLPLVVSGAFALLVAWLSIDPVRNLFSPRQAMNASFDKLHLVNTYGAFGTVGRERYEIIFEGTAERVPSEDSPWRAYEFKVKPGDPARSPRWISPYHHRLDWQIWFAAIPGVHYDLRTLPTPQHYPWTVHFVWKLLHNHPGVLGLLATNPFPEAPPKYVRALLYRYRYAALGNTQKVHWERERVGVWLPPVSPYTPEFRRFLEAAGWINRDTP